MRKSIALAAVLTVMAGCASGPAETDCTCTIDMDGFKVSWIKDNVGDRTMPANMFGASDEIIAELGIADGIPSSTSAFLIKEKDGVALFDAGMGSKDSQLMRGLSSLRLKPEDIDYVFITHLHGDHIGGLTSDGSPVFTSADIYLSKEEYDAFMNMDEKQSAAVKALAAAYGDNLKLFDYHDELPMDIDAMHIPGHTPGHTVYSKGKVLFVGDIMHGVALQKVHPELNARFDMDSTASVNSRRLIMSFKDDYYLAGSHFPAPGFLIPEQN